MNDPGDNLYILAFGDRTLAFTAEEFRAALERGRVLGTTAPTSGANGGQSERLLTASEISEATPGIPATWYLERARQGQIPFVKLGRYPRFLLSKIVEHGTVAPPASAGGTWARKKRAGACAP